MSNSDQAKSVASAFIKAFNEQHHSNLAQTLNYPHIRLAIGRFHTISTKEDFVTLSQNSQEALEKEGWDHTVVESMEVVHEGDDKVHLAIKNHRIDKSGDIYNSFETLWIVTLDEGHWGIQFRSSYLR
jgi:hypothetical protein